MSYGGEIRRKALRVNEPDYKLLKTNFMDERTQNILDAMKKNKSLEPIADLVRLAMVAETTAINAEEIGDKLSVFACQAEAAEDDLPPVSAWMKLCDTYKDGAREFARLLREAIKASKIEDLNENMKSYTDEVLEKTAWLIENDKEFANAFRRAVKARDDSENGPKDAE